MRSFSLALVAVVALLSQNAVARAVPSKTYRLPIRIMHVSIHCHLTTVVILETIGGNISIAYGEDAHAADVAGVLGSSV